MTTKNPPAHHDEIPLSDEGHLPIRQSNITPLGSNAPQTLGAVANAAVQEAVAKVQGAILLAKQFPRDYIKAVDSIKNACARENLAKQALYEYARGGTKITGPSIRLAETIAQYWGNLEFGWDEMARGRNPDGVGYSEITAFAWDVETNVKRTTKFQVRHWRDTNKGGYPLKDERDIYENNANQAARRLRACILNLIPGDVADEAVEQCETTLRSKIDVTPERISGMIEKFAAFGVGKAQLEKRIQSRVEAITPAQMLSLTKIYNSICDGISSPGEWFEIDIATGEKGKTNLEKFEAKLTKDASPNSEDAARPLGASGKMSSVQPEGGNADAPLPSELVIEEIAIIKEENGKPNWSQYFTDCAAFLNGLKTPAEFSEFREKNAKNLGLLGKNLRSWAERLDKIITEGEKKNG